IKELGLYSLYENASAASDRYFLLPGFKQYPKTCFLIEECVIDEDSGWKEGFVGTTELSQDFKTVTLYLNELFEIEKTAEESWENNNYYQAVCEVGEKIYKAKDAEELAAHISSVWSIRFKDNPKTADECLNVATKILDSLILR
ncbi:MAG: hypothetical protein FWG61_07150, partial [Firmicutes bacterium]|nr:hypothetical protein [Bacillota bacterium]